MVSVTSIRGNDICLSPTVPEGKAADVVQYSDSSGIPLVFASSMNSRQMLRVTSSPRASPSYTVATIAKGESGSQVNPSADIKPCGVSSSSATTVGALASSFTIIGVWGVVASSAPIDPVIGPARIILADILATSVTSWPLAAFGRMTCPCHNPVPVLLTIVSIPLILIETTKSSVIGRMSAVFWNLTVPLMLTRVLASA